MYPAAQSFGFSPGILRRKTQRWKTPLWKTRFCYILVRKRVMRMLRYEIKKFFSKTVNRAILIVVILIAAAYSFLAAGSIRYTDANGENPDGIGKIAAGRKLAADKNQWKGELTAERIADVVQSYKGLRRQYQGEVPDNEYGKTVQSYWDKFYSECVYDGT